MLGVAGGLGVTFTDDETEADAVLINTCCFIGDAKEESVNTILEMARLKEEGKCRALIVAGCLAQRYKEEIRRGDPGGRRNFRNHLLRRDRTGSDGAFGEDERDGEGTADSISVFTV